LKKAFYKFKGILEGSPKKMSLGVKNVALFRTLEWVDVLIYKKKHLVHDRFDSKTPNMRTTLGHATWRQLIAKGKNLQKM